MYVPPHQKKPRKIKIYPYIDNVVISLGGGGIYLIPRVR